jgi:hypothetical protein
VLILIQFMVTLMMYVREYLLPHYAGFLLNSVSPQIEDLSDHIHLFLKIPKINKIK